MFMFYVKILFEEVDKYKLLVVEFFGLIGNFFGVGVDIFLSIFVSFILVCCVFLEIVKKV